MPSQDEDFVRNVEHRARRQSPDVRSADLVRARPVGGSMTPWTFSASQIKAFRRCKRVWAFDKLLGIKQPTKPAAAKGSRVHKVLERYYDGGIPPDPKTEDGRIASYALPHLPDPHPAMDVEDKFTFEFGGLLWGGVVDLNWDPEIVPTNPLAFTVEVDHIISDHKTSADPAVWGLDEKSLPDDEQFIMYAMSKFEEISELDVIGGQWTYLKTRGKGQGIPVRTTIDRAEAKKRFLPIVETGHEMHELVQAQLRDANKLPPTPSACGDFGGCEYAKMGVCVLSTRDRLGGLFG